MECSMNQQTVQSCRSGGNMDFFQEKQLFNTKPLRDNYKISTSQKLVLLSFFLIALYLFKPMTVKAGTYRIEAEDFPSLGSWTSVSSGASGGYNLYSNQSGTGNKITGTFDLPPEAESGTYYLWFRGLSYNQGWRTSSPEINGFTAPSFGDEDCATVPSRVSVCVGAYELIPFANILAVTPNSTCSRWDVMVLTTDRDFQMPTTVTEIEAITKITPKALSFTYRIEAEDMPLGAWTPVETTGASEGAYLCSDISGESNRIKATFNLPAGSGTYYLHCRSLSYNGGWRTFSITINGTTDPTNFGDYIDGNPAIHWVNTSGGSYQLDMFDNTLSVTPNSAFSRWDTIILTTDSNFQLPESVEDIEELPRLSPVPITTYRVEVADISVPLSWTTGLDTGATEGTFLFSALSGTENKIEAIINLPERSGTYYLHCRALSYNEGWRTSSVAVNGITDPTDFGDYIDGTPGPHRVNTAGGSYQLDLFDNTLSVKPNSAVSRMDVLVFTTDKYYQMPEDPREIETITKIIPELNQQQIQTIGKENLPVLLFHGNRPWVGQETGSLLRKTGLDVKVIDGKELDGLSGAPIRDNLADPVEPEPADGITPAFTSLNNYRAIVVSGITQDNLDLFYTSLRLDALYRYVNNGGTLIVTDQSSSSLENMLPVTFNGTNAYNPDNYYCNTDNTSYLNSLPSEWPYFAGNRNITAKSNTETLVSTDVPMAHTVAGNIGNGKIIYVNTDWDRLGTYKQFRYWAYFTSFIGRLIAYGNGTSAESITLPTYRFEQPAATALGSVNMTIQAPSFNEPLITSAAAITDSSGLLDVTFDNGTSISFDKTSCYIDISIPKSGGTYNLQLSPLELLTNKIDTAYNNGTLEGAGATIGYTDIEAVYTYSGYTNSTGGGVTINLNGIAGYFGDDTFNISLDIRPKTVAINNTTYNGLGWAASVSNLNGDLEAAKWYSKTDAGTKSAWRMACYGTPRGFAIIPFDVANSSSSWSYFGNGQPFDYVADDNGTLLQFVDVPAVITTKQERESGTAVIELSTLNLIGRKNNVQVDLPHMWMVYAEEGGSASGWQAALQWLTRRYNTQEQWAVPQPCPTAIYSNNCSETDKTNGINSAYTLGFKVFKHALGEAALETIDDQSSIDIYTQINNAGLEAKVWSPLGYTQSISNPVATQYPGWLVKRKDQSVFEWFDFYPVFDFYNSDFRTHWQSICSNAINGNLKHLYIDMGGAMTSTINYAQADTVPQLPELIEVFRYLKNRNCSVAVEGQNPLAVNEFWYRMNLYANNTGAEYAFTGTSIGSYSTFDGSYAMDYFRLGMNNAFININTVPYALDFETIPNEMAMLEEIGNLNPLFNEAISLVDPPFVQQTDFGTVWTGANGAALFFWNPVSNLNLTLPSGWRIYKAEDKDGNTITFTNNTATDIPHKSVIMICNN